MNIPILDLEPQNGPLEAELKIAFERVLQSGRFILGPEVEQFERQAADYLGADHAIGVTSGTDALLLSLMTLGVGRDDEVLCPSFTFIATAGSIIRVGAKPVFVDIEPDSFNIDTADAARKVTSKTKAVIPVHLFGQAAEMDTLGQLSRDRNLSMIEDAAQAFGARYKDGPVGTFGDMGAFSFFPTKNLGGFGDAGMITTQNDDLARRARILRVHGGDPKYYHKVVGGNFRMDPLQAALLSVKLGRLPEQLERRRANADWYRENLSQTEPVRDGHILLPTETVRSGHTWNQFTIRVPDRKRDALRKHLGEHGIATEIYYPLALHQQECFRNIHPVKAVLPNAERLGGEVLSLPIFPGLARDQQERIADTIASFFAK